MVALLPPQRPTLWLCTGMHRIVLRTLCKVGTVKHIASHLEGLKRNSEEISAFVLCVCVFVVLVLVFFSGMNSDILIQQIETLFGSLFSYV